MKVKKSQFTICTLENITDYIKIEKPGIYYYLFIHNSTKKIEKEIVINLNNPDIKFYLMGAIYMYGSAECKLKIEMCHTKGNNKARVNVKTVLKDNAIFNFEGMIKIAKNSHKANSYLKQDNLLVSDKTVCNTSPQLEIKADDVKASHGATIAGFNSEDLFYLKSRALNDEFSKKILEESFLSKAFGRHTEKIYKYLGRDKIIVN